MDKGSRICQYISVTMTLLSAVRTERLFFLEPFWSSGIKSNFSACRITSFSIVLLFMLNATKTIELFSSLQRRKYYPSLAIENR